MKKVWKKLFPLAMSLVMALVLTPVLLDTPAEASVWIPGGDYIVDGWKIHCSRLDLGYNMTLEGYVGEDKDFLTEVVFPSDFRGAEFGVHNAGQTVPTNYIEGEAACGFLNATSFVFPNHVNTTRCVPVRDNPKLKTLAQPDGVETIRRMDLQDCPALESVYYPPTIGGVNNLFLEGTYAAGCTSLKDIYFYGEKPNNYDLLEIAEGKANAHLQVHYLEEHAASWAGTYNAVPFKAKGELALYGVVGEDYTVRVVDAVNGRAISGADVAAEYRQSEQNKAVTTGADGSVSIPGPYQFITVTASGYYADVSAPNGPMNVVYLTPNNMGDVLTKLTLARDDGEPYNILHMGGAYIVTPGAQRTLTFTAAAAGNASRYELWQPPRMLASSIDGVLKINDEDLNTGRPLVIKTYFSGSQVPVFESVRVQVKEPNLPARVELGDSAMLEVDPNAPLYGGRNFSANFGHLTLATATDPFTGGWRILLGKDVEDDDLLEKFAQVKKLIDIPSKEDTSDAWDNCGDAVTHTKKALQILNGTKGVSPLLDTPERDTSIDWSIGAYLEGGMEDDVLTGRMFFSIEAEGSVSVGPPYPVYGSFGVIGRMEADGTLRLEMDTGSVQFLVGLNGEFGLKLSAGLGYDGAVSVGVYGEGVLGVGGQITNRRDEETGKSLSGFEELYLKGEFGAEYTFLWKEGDVALLTGKVTLWPELKAEGTVGPQARAALGRRLTDSVGYHDMDRDYLGREEPAEEAEPMTRAAAPRAASIEGSLYHNGFYAPDVQTVILDGWPLVVRVDDAGWSRGDNDRSALYYNMYTPLFNHWESNMLFADDGTADFSPSLCSDGTTAYVVWQNAKQSLESVEATEAGQYFELSAAKITVNSSGRYREPDVTSLTPVTKDNAVYENMPRTALLDDGTLGVAWVESSENDVFGMQGTQTIKLSVYDVVSDTWTEQTVGTAEAGVTALALGSLDGSKFSVAWITDDDRDQSTEDDRTLLLWTDGKAEVTALRMYSSPQSPAFVKLIDGTVLTWYDGDVGRVIKYDVTGAEAPLGNFILSSAPTSIAGDSEGRIAVFSTETANNRGNTVLTAYDPAVRAWGQTTQVVETAENSYFFQPKAVYRDADDLWAVAGKKNVTQMTVNVDPIHPESGGTMEVKKNVGLAVLKIGAVKPKFIVNGAYLDPETPEDGDSLRIVTSVTNVGAVAGAPTLTMTGDMNISTPKFTGLETIPSGGTVEIPLTLKKSDFRGGSYTVYVDGESSTAPGIIIGADLEVTARSLSVNGRNSVAIAVENKGAVNAEAGKLVITDDANGAPCAYFDLPAIPVGQSAKLVYDLTDDGVFHSGSTARLKVRTSTPTVQTYLFNDSATVTFTKFSADMIEPDWTAVDAAALSQVTYGKTNAQMFRDLPKTGTTIGTAELEGAYTVNEPDVIQAAGDDRTVTVTFTVTAEGDHHGETFTKEYTVKVEKASIADIVPTVTGIAKVGNTLTASLPGVIAPDSQVDWQWFVISAGADGVQTETPIPGATAAAYPLTEERAGATVAVKATAKESNYTGVSRTSVPVTVEKLALSGALTIAETNGTGTAGVIDAGDTITAVTTGLLPVGAQTGGTFQWYRNDGIVDTAHNDRYTVTGEDMAATLKVVYTPDQSRYTGTAQASVAVGKRVLAGTVVLSRENDRLTVTVSLENVPADAYKLVWLRDGQEFEGPELSYLLTDSDKGHIFTVKAVALEEGTYTGEVASESVTIPSDSTEPPTPTEPSGVGSDNYYTLTASAGEGGSISPVGKVTAQQGLRKTFTITADEGYEIADVLVDGESVGAVGSYVFQQVSRRHTIEAQFRRVEQESSKELSFVDVSIDAWYHDAVKYVVDKGLFNGTSESSFSPNVVMTRSMLAAVLYRMVGQPDMSEADWGYPYSDVDADAYYTTAVYWARLQGIVTGYDDARFGPDDPITREQLAVMLWRYAGASKAEGALDAFSDSAQAGEWGIDGLRWAVEQGILTGKGGGVLDPKGQATRAEVAAMLMRLCEREEQK